MNDICNFISPNDTRTSVIYYNFVYETTFKKLKQPFISLNYCIHLVTKGTGSFKTRTSSAKLTPGTLFFTFPNQFYKIEGSDDLAYLYITFSGSAAAKILESLEINPKHNIYYGFEHLIKFWMTSIRRFTRINANVLTEGVFMYTLSFIDNTKTADKGATSSDRFDYILEYINNNYAQADISIKKVADIFFYSEKYFSSMFKKKTGTKFTDYVNNLRIQHALKLMEGGVTTVGELATRSGFVDSFYFSKVFKKATGKSPTEYKKNGLS